VKVTVGLAVAVETVVPVKVALGVDEGVAVRVAVETEPPVEVAVGVDGGVTVVVTVKVFVIVAVALVVAVTVCVAVGPPTVAVLVGVAETTGVRVTVKVLSPEMIGAAGLVLLLQLTAVKKMKDSIKNRTDIPRASKILIFFTINPFAA
jgi:hypothetical protein